MAGVGMTPEGILTNPMVYDLMAEMMVSIDGAWWDVLQLMVSTSAACMRTFGMHT
jgi:hypothetical protein